MDCGPRRGGRGQRAECVCARVCTCVPLASVPERGVCVRTYCWGGSESHPGSCFRVHVRTAGSGHVGEGEERAGDEAGKAEANKRREPGPPTPASGLHLAGAGIHWPTGLSRGEAGHVPCIVCGPPWAGGAQALSEEAGGREWSPVESRWPAIAPGSGPLRNGGRSCTRGVREAGQGLLRRIRGPRPVSTG